MLTIDFETRSEADLRVVGPVKYSRDPTTQILCMAYKQGDGQVGIAVDPDMPNPRERETLDHLDKNLLTDTDVEAHNAMFEYVLYHNVLMPRYDLPAIPQHRWYCSMAKASRLSLPPSLDGATKALNLGIEKDMAGNRLMLKLCKPRPTWARKKTGEKWFGTPDEFERLYQYCIQDVQTEHELSRALNRYALQKGVV